MVHAVTHDPYRLLEFALRESDWVLADLLARRLGANEPAIHSLAELTRDLDLDESPR